MEKHAQATQASIERGRLETERNIHTVKTQLVALRKDLEAGMAQAKTDLQAGLAQAKTDLLAVKTELLEGLAQARTDLQAGLAQARTDLLAVKTELLEGLAQAKTDLQAGLAQAKTDLLAVKTELLEGQLAAAAELIEAKKALLEVKETTKETMKEVLEDTGIRLDSAADELAEASMTLKAATAKMREEMATARATLRLGLVSDLGTSVVASANWIARRHNSHRDALWQELAADGPDSNSFMIGAVDGSAINTAAPLGHKPAHDHGLWFPRNSAELQEATVEQVDALLFFYAIPDPRDPTKQFGAAAPLLEKKIAALEHFLSH